MSGVLQTFTALVCRIQLGRITRDLGCEACTFPVRWFSVIDACPENVTETGGNSDNGKRA